MVQIVCDRRSVFEVYLQPISLRCGLLALSREAIDLMVREPVALRTKEESALRQRVADLKLILAIRSSA